LRTSTVWKRKLQFGMGWGGRREKIVLIFQDVEKLRGLAAGKWNAGSEAEAAAKAGDVGAAGGGDTGNLVKGFSTYMLIAAEFPRLPP